jgi:hypothetical protein
MTLNSHDVATISRTSAQTAHGPHDESELHELLTVEDVPRC